MKMTFRQRIIFELGRLRRKQLHPLQQLFWESTLRCNVHCLHCGSDCSSSEVTPDMPAEDFLRVIDQSVTPHVDPHKVLIIIPGGEPLMRKDLAEVGVALATRLSLGHGHQRIDTHRKTLQRTHGCGFALYSH